jgi:hypothetical protein
MIALSVHTVSESLLDFLGETKTTADICADIYATEAAQQNLGMYRVHSRYAHGINITLGSRIAFIGNKNDELVPFGAIVDTHDLPLLTQANAENYYWDRARRALVSSEISIDLKTAQSSSNKLSECLGQIKGCGTSWCVQVEDILKAHLTGFGMSVPAFLDAKIAALQDLKRALVGTSESVAKQVFTGWLGLGKGLTPSGDDVITGLLMADSFNSFIGTQAKLVLAKLVAQDITTDVSRSQLLAAMDGLASSSWIAFMAAVKTADSMKQIENVRRILAYGHSSGADMFAGFAVGTRIFAGDL